MDMKKDNTGFVLRLASGVGLNQADHAVVSGGPDMLCVVRANVESGKYNPLEGLSLRDKLSLLSYLVFLRENSYTDTSKGHSPITDSARQVAADGGLYSGDERALDYDLALCLNKTRGILSVLVGIDDKGTPYQVVSGE